METPDERRQFWSAEEVRQIAQEEGIDLTHCTISSSFQCVPGINRTEVVAALRFLAAIPRDDPFVG